ncbi:hypothetical protein ACFSTH_12620 [Paenibacillus yanchengensis]|uniref:Uncharacterized protein n=1 Tax=Paenibacillus yanchengensis TaxID=2035833 RepID=A0ABW4YIC0_9BACL
MNVETHPLSVEGTHANRMIHLESEQLIIEPYFIDKFGSVRVISPAKMEGRLTAVTKHLTDPQNKVVFYTMESGLYEVDVHSLQVTTLYRDPNHMNPMMYLLPGVHGKGAYSGQGRLVVSNNGLGGVLAEWTGEGDAGKRENWTIVDQNKYTEITGPGGIYGSPTDEAPIWALGWDEKSVLLNVCENKSRQRYRLPMGSYTHSADDGWFTEWPRIRDIGETDWLMDMFGTLFWFPPTFSEANSSGIRPISVHHKMIVDFAKWNEQLVLGCNDASVQENPLTGRCQSNLLFTSVDKLKDFGNPTGFGGVWANEDVTAGQYSEPYLFAGYEQRTLHLSHQQDEKVTFAIELDQQGYGNWTTYQTITVPAHSYQYVIFPQQLQAEWIRLQVQQASSKVTAHYHYSPATGNKEQPAMFTALASIGSTVERTDGLLINADDMDLPLYMVRQARDDVGKATQQTLYKWNEQLQIKEVKDDSLCSEFVDKYSITTDCKVDAASVIIRASDGQQYRLPKSAATKNNNSVQQARAIREVVTERKLLNIHGSFYELPVDRSGGVQKIQPICTHEKHIYDFCSWRGMLVLSGLMTEKELDNNAVSIDSTISEHVCYNHDVGLWFGNVDD